MNYRIKQQFLPGVLVGQECEAKGSQLMTIFVKTGNLNVGYILIDEDYAKQHPEIFEPVRWKPKHGDTFYLIAGNGSILSDEYANTSYFEKYSRFGNCFETEQAAEQARDKIKKLLTEYA